MKGVVGQSSSAAQLVHTTVETGKPLDRGGFQGP